MRRDAFQAEIYYGDGRGLPTVIVKIPNRLPEYPHRYPENRKTRLSTQRDAMRIDVDGNSYKSIHSIGSPACDVGAVVTTAAQRRATARDSSRA